MDLDYCLPLLVRSVLKKILQVVTLVIDFSFSYTRSIIQITFNSYGNSLQHFFLMRGTSTAIWCVESETIMK